MGLFSFVGDILGDITGTTKAADKAAGAITAGEEAALGFQREAFDYAKGVQQPVLDIRNQALPQLYGFYDPSNPQGQQQFIDQAKASPFYQSQIAAGEEAVARNAAAGFGGGLRGGNINQALAQNSQNVLRNAVNQQLQGLGGFAQTPINTSSVTNQLNQMGQTTAQGNIARGQAYQDAAGQSMGMLSALGSAAIGSM